MYKFLYLFILLFLALSANAQEFNANVEVNTPQLNKNDPQLFKEMERDLQEFFNNQSFTNESYETHERIDCNFFFTIKDEIGDETFTADLTIQASRPVYGSEYKTILLSYQDGEVKFNYSNGVQIQFASDGYINNLSSVLSYWAMIVIGLDRDTFSPKGGDPYFKIAESILGSIPDGVARDVGGWRALDSDRNRFWLVENLLNPKVEDFRLAMYRYHLQGLDVMHANSQTGQQSIMEALNIVKATRDEYPNNMIVQLFARAKVNEVVEIMAKANRTYQKNTFNVMSSIDPSNRSAYMKLK